MLTKVGDGAFLTFTHWRKVRAISAEGSVIELTARWHYVSTEPRLESVPIPLC